MTKMQSPTESNSPGTACPVSEGAELHLLGWIACHETGGQVDLPLQAPPPPSLTQHCNSLIGVSRRLSAHRDPQELSKTSQPKRARLFSPTDWLSSSTKKAPTPFR